MAVWHQGMDRAGQHEGRSDDKAAKGGDAVFGRSGGGSGGIHTDLIASATRPIAMPKAKENQ